MSLRRDNLHLLLAHADTARPVLEDGVGLHTVQMAAVAQPLEPRYLASWDSDPDVLSEQRWGIIAPEGPAGDRLLGHVAELIRTREQEQGGRAARIYRVPARMSQFEVADWRRKVLDPTDGLDTDVPRYLLILGDLDEVPITVQQILAMRYFVGRLAFDNEDGYAAYAAKALRWQAQPSSHTTGRALFHTVHDGTPATAVTNEYLMRPGLDILRREQQTGALLLSAGDLMELGSQVSPAPADLLGATASEQPGVLLSACHGMGAPRGGWKSAEEQRRLQGAMSFGQGMQLSGDELRTGRFLAGGVWCMFTCFGAGTPEASAYVPWLTELSKLENLSTNVAPLLATLPQSGDRPFIAHVPKAALANPDGPLAAVGHVDLAWTFSFQDLDIGTGTTRAGWFMGMVHSLLKRRRVGVAFDRLYSAATQVAVHLSTSGRIEVDRDGKRRVHTTGAARYHKLRMLQEDLSGYLLLGDPAVRLPLHEAKIERNAFSIFGSEFTDIRVAQEVRAPAQAPDAGAQERIAAFERELAEIVLGDKTQRAAARCLGVDTEELERWRRAYVEAGRAALHALMHKKS